MGWLRHVERTEHRMKIATADGGRQATEHRLVVAALRMMPDHVGAGDEGKTKRNAAKRRRKERA